MLRTLASPLPSSATKQILVPSGDGLGYSSSTSVVLRQVDGVGAVGVAQVELPVAVAVGFVDDLVRVVLSSASRSGDSSAGFSSERTGAVKRAVHVSTVNPSAEKTCFIGTFSSGDVSAAQPSQRYCMAETG